MDRGLKRPAHRRALGRTGRPFQALQMPHYYELLKDLSQGIEPWKGSGSYQKGHSRLTLKSLFVKKAVAHI